MRQTLPPSGRTLAKKSSQSPVMSSSPLTRRAGVRGGLSKVATLCLLCLLCLGQTVTLTAQQRPVTKGRQPTKGRPGTTVSSTPLDPVVTAYVNMDEISKKQKRVNALRPAGVIINEAKPVPGSIQDSPATEGEPPAASQPAQDVDPGAPAVPGPTPTTSFQGEFDEAVGGGPSGFFTIPPDTNGSVGLTKVFTNVNNNYVVQDKLTGTRLSVVSMDAFWAPTGATGLFDPQIQYDPYNNRWVLAATSNGQTANSSIVVAISQTADPSGGYTMFRFVVGCANGTAGCTAGGEWADFPMLGFNKNWVSIAVNMFSISANANNNFKNLVLNYPALRGGTSNGTLFAGGGIGFCNHPVTTYSATEETLYLAEHLSSGGATYRVSTITGTPSSPSFTLGATKTRPGGGWTQPGGNTLPQTCTAAPCPATPVKLDSGDAQVRSNPVFRNGSIWYAQTIGLPAGVLTHTSAQWTRVNTAGDFVDGGRVDDPTATATNGGKWYAYPSLTVNKNSDVMMGYSQFASNQFGSAGYSFRLGTDAAATMRDPVIYKAGVDYYFKTFGTGRNRWGDYSHTMIDPTNDRDMWTVQEYADARTPAGCTPADASVCTRWATWWASVSVPAASGDLMISEFRLRGPNGANDEFIEIYNPSTAIHTVQTVDGSAGYGIAASDGSVRCVIPNGTNIPARGHYLCVNSVGYSLASYPAGNGTTATGDATYTADIPDNTGIGIFSTATFANFSAATRIDSVGPTTELNPLFKEGTGYPALTPFSVDYSFYRDLLSGFARDTDNNSTDFLFVDTAGTCAFAVACTAQNALRSGAHLGAPGPENMSSPVFRGDRVKASSIDLLQPSTAPPNRVRDFTSDPANNSTFGTLSFRRTFNNTTGANVTRLRFRVVDITTFPEAGAVPGTADLRVRTSPTVVVSVTGGGTVTAQGLTLEQPPSQTNGGAFNSTVSAGTITSGSPIPPGGSISVNFLVGIQGPGFFRFFILVEALP
jgi:hypothetical protein